MDNNQPILRVENLRKIFGGLVALNGVSFEVAGKGIHAVIGPNGAGKTTALNVISGIYPPTSGRIFLDGKDITHLRPHQVAYQGVTRTFQNLQVFRNMTVLENVMVGLHSKTTCEFTSCLLHLPRLKREEKVVRERAAEILEVLHLEDKAALMSGGLPYGDQKRVEVARALAASPRLILMDEPVAGLNLNETEEMAEIILKIRETGTTVLLVEHDMNLVMTVSDEIAVLNYGEKIAQGKPREIQTDERVAEAYLGREFEPC
jgi:branched-chain amino acid transport system ATP-binding protein